MHHSSKLKKKIRTNDALEKKKRIIRIILLEFILTIIISLQDLNYYIFDENPFL